MLNKNVLFGFDGKNAKIQEELSDALRKLISSDSKIVVEGKRDAAALRAIGVEKERIILTAQKPISDVLPKLRGKEIIDMLDNDEKGRKKSAELYKSGLKINAKLKKIILSEIKSKHVEDLLNFLEKSCI